MIGLRDRDLSVRAVRLEKDVTPTTTMRARGWSRKALSKT
jgi:hypothetical protein